MYLYFFFFHLTNFNSWFLILESGTLAVRAFRSEKHPHQMLILQCSMEEDCSAQLRKASAEHHCLIKTHQADWSNIDWPTDWSLLSPKGISALSGHIQISSLVVRFRGQLPVRCLKTARDALRTTTLITCAVLFFIHLVCHSERQTTADERHRAAVYCCQATRRQSEVINTEHVAWPNHTTFDSAPLGSEVNQNEMEIFNKTKLLFWCEWRPVN